MILNRVSSGDGVAAAYQPIVDTARGVIAGYEGLSRFDLPTGTGPEELFRATRRVGRSAEIESMCLRAVLADRRSIPTNCFLTVNVSPDVLGDELIRQVWRENPDLRGVIVEITEQTAIESYTALEPDLDRLRGQGALIAVDDAGSGYAGLTHILDLKPALIKLDRELIRGIDADEAKRALVDMLGTFANRIDCWLLAEGIETEAEYDTITALGVPLAQGYYLAHPGPAWPALDATIIPAALAPQESTVRDVLEAPPTAESTAVAATLFSRHSELRTVALIDDHNRPIALLDINSAHLGVTTDAMRVNLDTPTKDALLRAITRDPGNRYDPLIITDNAGRYSGIARIERLITTAFS